MKFSPFMKVAPSASVMMNSLALEKKSKGQRVYNLAAGEPMVDTHPLVVEAAQKAMQEGKTHYPPVAGIPELRAAVTEWMNTTYATSYTAAQSLVTCGGKYGIFALCQALLEPGDAVLIPAPYWVSYPSMVQLFGGVPIEISTEETNGWKLSIADLERVWTPQTKILMFNNASNPTGVLYSHEEIEKILQWANTKNIIVISDEVYSGLVYDGKKFISCGSFPQFQENTVIIQSCSKHFAMTGWRVGFVFARQEVIKTLTMLQGQSTTGTSSISQWAALAAVQNASEIIPLVRMAMQERRDVVIRTFEESFGKKLLTPSSSLYLFISLALLEREGQSSEMFAMELLEKANIATVPGKAFGKEGYLRFSFGDVPAELELAIIALAAYIKKPGSLA
ncbi:pyridoxal phosphate-dependent aminotransferase [Candidatus Uhrbacteria bacterium]|nr:pyridoxal phosphate-dependent aminotransferase [Candidatus Uhrbacteria bacterium]